MPCVELFYMKKAECTLGEGVAFWKCHAKRREKSWRMTKTFSVQKIISLVTFWLPNYQKKCSHLIFLDFFWKTTAFEPLFAVLQILEDFQVPFEAMNIHFIYSKPNNAAYIITFQREKVNWFKCNNYRSLKVKVIIDVYLLCEQKITICKNNLTLGRKDKLFAYFKA